MPKRGNEHGQVSKEDFDALQDRNDSSEEPRGPFSRASNDQLKRRKILKVSSASKWKSPAVGGNKAPGGGASLAAGGIFGGVRLTAGTTPASTNNPFSNVSLAGSTVPKPKQKKQSSIAQKSLELNKMMMQYFIDKAKTHPRNAYREAANDFVGYSNALKKAYFGENETNNEASAAASGASLSPFASNGTGNKVNNSSPFATNVSSVPSTAAPAPTPFAGFSLCSKSPAPALVSTPEADPPNDAATPAPSSPRDADSSVSKDANSDWDIQYQVRAQYYKSIDPKAAPKSFYTGPLELETSKTTGKHRMIMRNEAGLVQLNLAIVKDMPFTKDLQTNAKNVKFAFVNFYAQEQDSDTKTLFKMRVNPQNLDALYDNLTKLAAK